MDPEIKKKLDEQSAKIDAIYQSVEKTRKYFQMIVWGTVIMFVIPLILLAFILPSVMQSYSSALNDLGI